MNTQEASEDGYATPKSVPTTPSPCSFHPGITPLERRLGTLENGMAALTLQQEAHQQQPKSQTKGKPHPGKAAREKKRAEKNHSSPGASSSNSWQHVERPEQSHNIQNVSTKLGKSASISRLPADVKEFAAGDSAAAATGSPEVKLSEQELEMWNRLTKAASSDRDMAAFLYQGSRQNAKKFGIASRSASASTRSRRSDENDGDDGDQDQQSGTTLQALPALPVVSDSAPLELSSSPAAESRPATANLAEVPQALQKAIAPNANSFPQSVHETKAASPSIREEAQAAPVPSKAAASVDQPKAGVSCMHQEAGAPAVPPKAEALPVAVNQPKSYSPPLRQDFTGTPPVAPQMAPMPKVNSVAVPKVNPVLNMLAAAKAKAGTPLPPQPTPAVAHTKAPAPNPVIPPVIAPLNPGPAPVQQDWLARFADQTRRAGHTDVGVALQSGRPVFRSTFMEEPGVFGCAWEGEHGYRSRTGALHDTRNKPPGDCFICGGDHWRKDCPRHRRRG